MGAAEWINVCIAVITGLVCIANFWLLRETRRTSKIMEAQIAANTRPYVQVGITTRRGEPVLMLMVSNTGNSPATNLRLTIDRDFYRGSERIPSANFRTYNAFNEVIASFGPKTELRFFMGVGADVFENLELCPRQFNVTAEYSHGSERYVETTTLDLNPFNLHDASSDLVTARLRDIRDALQVIAQKMT